MRLTKAAALALSGVLLAGGLAQASFAQQPAAAQAGPQRGPGEHRRPDPEAMAQRRAEHLRAALQLRPDQEGALKAFLESVKPGARPDRGQRQAMAQMTTPQRLDAHRARMAERLARMDQRIAATKRFYAQLTPAQQKAFDALRPQGKGGHHGGRGMRGHGPMGHGE